MNGWEAAGYLFLALIWAAIGSVVTVLLLLHWSDQRRCEGMTRRGVCTRPFGHDGPCR